MGEAASPTLTWYANRENSLRIESVVAGAAIDVSTWTWTCQIRPSVDGDPVIHLAVDMTEAADGAVTATLLAEQSVGLADEVWSLGVDVTISGSESQIVKTNTVRFEEPVEP